MKTQPVGVWVALVVALWGGVALAAPRKPRGRAAADAGKRAVMLPAARLDAVRALLLSDDDAASLEAAKALGASGAANASDPLIELLAAGAAAARCTAALDALGKLSDAGVLTSAAAFEVLELYAGHREPELRQRAVKALGAMRGEPRAVPTLIARLGDAAPNVRATAGDALAARRELKAAPRLLALVKRSDQGAASPLAALATPDMVPHIAELAGSVEDGVLATTLGDYAKRSDVADKLRIDVLRTVANLSGAAATTALIEYIASVPAKDDRPSKKEAQKLLDERGTKE